MITVIPALNPCPACGGTNNCIELTGSWKRDKHNGFNYHTEYATVECDCGASYKLGSVTNYGHGEVITDALLAQWVADYNKKRRRVS